MRAAVLALSCLLVTAVGVASAQTPLLRGLASPAVIQPLVREGVSRVRAVDADIAGLRAVQPAPVDALASAANTVTLELFPDVQVAVALDRRDDLPDGAVTFAGSIVGEADGRAIFAVVDDTLAVDVILPRARYEVRYRADGHHQVQQVDGAFTCGTASPPADALVAAAARPAIAEPVLEGPPVVVDVLLVYTPRAQADAGGAAGIRSTIHLAIAATNDALARSLVPHRVRAVHIAPTNYVESGRYTGPGGDLNRLHDPADGFMDEVPVLRDSVQADLVALLAGPASDATGVAGLMGSFNPLAGRTDGYSVTAAYASSGVLPHELGHSLSLHHDPETSPGAATLLPYGRGYRIPGRFATIMAYACPASQAPCPHIRNYSNPDVLHQGTPTGVANVHDEAFALTQTMPVAASYRGCRTRITPAETLLRLGPAGGTFAIDVATDSECVWTAEHSGAPPSWVTLGANPLGRNGGIATITVAANPTGNVRRHAVQISEHYIDIVQRPCVSVTTPMPMRISGAGGTGTVMLDAEPTCTWSVDPMPGSSSLTLTSPLTGTGPGQVTFSVAPASSSTEYPLQYAVTLRVATTFTAVITVIRDGNICGGAVNVSPAAMDVPGSGGTFPVTVSAPPSCAWSLYGPPEWISAATAASGTGSGSVSLTFQPTTTSYGRTAAIAVGGRAIRIVQAGCEATLQLPAEIGADGGSIEVPVTAAPGCQWTPTSTSAALGTTVRASQGSGSFTLQVQPNPDATSRQLTFTMNERPHTVTQRGRALLRRYLSEGATGSFFSTRLALLNPGADPVEGQLRFQLASGAVRTRSVTVPARRRMTITTESVPDLGSADFATVLESSGTLLLDRTMTWDRSGFGSHAETSLPEPSRTWYLAEGSTAGDFSLFYLLQNPNPVATAATITFLLPGGAAPIVRTFPVGANARRTIPIDSLGPPLDATDLSAVITAPDPIIVERAMYATRAGQNFAAGHNSSGVTAAATEWFLAEGATGAFFDLFVLVANPNPQPAQLTIDYLLPNGTTLSKEYVVPANGRSTIWVDDEQIPARSGQRPLADVSVSTAVRSTNGVPVIVERAMWWPGPQLTTDYWMEAHNSSGATVTGTRWALAEGEVGGPNAAETYILIANTSTADGSVRVQLLFEDGTTAERVLTVPARSRTTISGGSFAAAAERRFGAVVESLGPAPVQIVVERAMYSNANGVFWAAGTNALGTRLAP